MGGNAIGNFPKFRLTGKAGKGVIRPVNLETVMFKVNAFVRNGVFLCEIPGFYHFSAAMSSAGKGDIAIDIWHTREENEVEVSTKLIYARLVFNSRGESWRSSAKRENFPRSYHGC